MSLREIRAKILLCKQKLRQHYAYTKLLFLAAVFIIAINVYNHNRKVGINPKFKKLPLPKIVIATIVCDSNGTESSHSFTESSKAVTLIKSVIISAKLYDISTSRLAFYVFIENEKQQTFFLTQLQDHGFHLDDLGVTIHFHYSLAVVPVEIHSQVDYNNTKRCAFVSLFLQTALPNIPSVIFLATNTVVTGSILDIWQIFPDMHGEQLIGVIKPNERDAVSSGVMLMNLTKMRIQKWEEIVVNTFRNYFTKNIQLDHHKLLQTIENNLTELFHHIPCQFNFAHVYCDSGLTCPSVLNDKRGIRVIQGTEARLFDSKYSFHFIFETYRDYRFGNNNVYDGIVTPILQHYDSLNSESKCFGVLDRILYKSLFS